jgi:hypothetical protein
MLHRIGAATIVALRDLANFDFRRMRRRRPRLHPGSWPIWHWHNHQPRQDQLDAMHKSDAGHEDATVHMSNVSRMTGEFDDGCPESTEFQVDPSTRNH